MSHSLQHLCHWSAPMYLSSDSARDMMASNPREEPMLTTMRSTRQVSGQWLSEPVPISAIIHSVMPALNTSERTVSTQPYRADVRHERQPHG